MVQRGLGAAAKADLVEAKLVTVNGDVLGAGSSLGPVAPLEVAVEIGLASVLADGPLLDVAGQIEHVGLVGALELRARGLGLIDVRDVLGSGGSGRAVGLGLGQELVE